jgi:hypothetical protein
MDSMERLAHSLEQAVGLIHALRRENRDLARQASKASGLEARSMELEVAQVELGRLRQELEELKSVQVRDPEAQERARQAELEAAALAAQLEDEKQRRLQEKAGLEARISELELKAIAMSREETMPAPDRTPELESLALRCSELEAMLAARSTELEGSKGDVTALQVKIAALGVELDGLRATAASKESIEAEKASIRKQKKVLGLIAKERETTRRKLEEIYSVLDNLRLGS